MYRKSLSLFILAFIALAPLTAQKKPVTLQDAFSNRELSGGRPASVRWLKDGKSYSIQKPDKETKVTNIWKVDVKTGKEELLIDVSGLKSPESDKPFQYVSYQWSEDESAIIFTLSQKNIWRHSTTGDYAVYLVKSKKLIPLPVKTSGMRNVKVSPDGRWVGYVFEDNIWIFALETGKEMQLTHDTDDFVYNGRFGWVYEEEFSIVDGWAWSPDSKRIAFWREDERQVPEIKLTNWDELYYEFTAIRYPKAGDKNPIERIGVIEIASLKTTWMDIGKETDIYIPRMFWTEDPNTLFIYRLNRNQNHLELLSADVTTGKTRVILEEKSATGWIEVEDSSILHFLKSRKQFLWMSERDGWNHLYLYDYSGKLIHRVTKGEWEVMQLAGVSKDEKSVYYVSTEDTPLERHLYRINIDGAKKEKLTKETGVHSINMNSTCEFFIDSWSSTIQPPSAHIKDGKGKALRMMSEAKKETFENYHWSQKEVFSFTTSDGMLLYCSMIKPPNFDSNKKYPVYFDVYGGPGRQNVRNQWPGALHQWIANEGFIVFQIDNRGGGARGTAFKHAVYKQLGKWEAHDYIEGAKYLATIPYVDTENIGIWGWSYGGYMAALTLLLGGDYFKAAVSIAPVTDWKFYDTIYTERYMLRPQDNPDGYKVGSCLEHADSLKGRLLIIHGGADDNVHMQNTVQFIDKLINDGKQFDMRLYPNGNHGMVNSMKARFGLFEYFMGFMKRNLQGT